MKKQLRFLYRYFTTTRRWRWWLNRQTLIILLGAALFLGVLVLTTPHPAVSAGLTPTPVLTLTPGVPTHTPLPPEYQNNQTETIGIAFVGAILVLIVVMAVALFMPRENNQS